MLICYQYYNDVEYFMKTKLPGNIRVSRGPTFRELKTTVLPNHNSGSKIAVRVRCTIVSFTTFCIVRFHKTFFAGSLTLIFLLFTFSGLNVPFWSSQIRMNFFISLTCISYSLIKHKWCQNCNITNFMKFRIFLP